MSRRCRTTVRSTTVDQRDKLRAVSEFRRRSSHVGLLRSRAACDNWEITCVTSMVREICSTSNFRVTSWNRWHDRLSQSLRPLKSPTSVCTLVGVKSTYPVTENHNKNGYVNYTTFTRTSSRPMRTTIMTPSTPTRMTRTITTRAICTSEHSSALFSRVSCLDVES